MSAIWIWLALTAGATDLQHDLTWSLKVGGKDAGKRDISVKYVHSDDGQRRILETWTELEGQVGPIPIVFRQRMTAHTATRTPGSFHSVTESNGMPGEVQARWTPAAWWVTTNVNGHARTLDMPTDRIDISTADLMDPGTSFNLGRYDRVRILSAETGEIYVGEVGDLGNKDIKIDGQKIRCQGWSWTSPVGKSEFWYNADGFLVDYTMYVVGVEVSGRLSQPPPPGVDDFPVAVGGASIEVIDL